MSSLTMSLKHHQH